MAAVIHHGGAGTNAAALRARAEDGLARAVACVEAAVSA
jgi:hypothetical protein